MRIAAVGRALPPHHYEQDELIEAFREHWGPLIHNPARLEQLHANVLVGARNLALPMEAYSTLSGFREANDAYIQVAVDVGSQAIVDALMEADLRPEDVDHLFFVTVTGVSTPSIDARIVNRLRMRQDVKRTPIFGLGCLAGAAGLARVADYLRGHPNDVALLLSVELCSLTLQRDDLSIANLIGSGLFGDGAAAVVMTGAGRTGTGPWVVASRSRLYPDTEELLGWEITTGGFRLLLSGEIPNVIGEHLRADVDGFLAEHGLTRADLQSYVCHPGGPRILAACEEALDVPRSALQLSWDSLARVGNLSSASVLFILRELADNQRPPPDSWGLMLAIGPGLALELVLLRW